MSTATATATSQDRAYARHEFTLGQGPAARAAIGLVVLATDHTIEHEWRKLIDLEGVAVYETRLANSPDIRPETLAEMEKEIAPAVSLLLPGQRMDVVAFGCTSGAMVIGEEQVFARVRAVRPHVRCTSPITAARAAFEALGVRRIGLLTPYVRSVSDWMAGYLVDKGFEIPAAASYEHADDNEVARIDAESIAASVRMLAASPEVDAVFVSCTSLRVAELVAPLETATGKPVLSSNHAMAWHALRLAGIRDALPQWGRLFTV